LDLFALAVIFAQMIIGLEFSELHKLILFNANFPIKCRKVPVLDMRVWGQLACPEV
jgi:hypothetical protein